MISPSAEVARPQRLEGIQALRAMAALMVLVAHILSEAGTRFGVGGHDYFFVPWAMGVDIFFVVSGFIMYYTSYKYIGTESYYWKFLKKRFLRVVPLYYFFTTLMILVLLILPGALGKTEMDVGQIVTSYLFIPYERYDGRMAPVLSLGWTLNYEIFFYLIFAFFCMLPKKYFLYSISAFFVFLVALGQIIKIDWAPYIFWTSPVILEFILGVWIAYLYLRAGPRTNLFACLFLFFGGLAWASWWWHFDRYIMDEFLQQGIAAVMIVAAVTLFLSPFDASRIPRIVTRLGDSSYSLYLSHRFTLRAITLVWTALVPAGFVFGWLFVLVAVVSCIVGGHLVYLFIEQPVLSALRTHKDGRTKSEVWRQELRNAATPFLQVLRRSGPK